MSTVPSIDGVQAVQSQASDKQRQADPTRTATLRPTRLGQVESRGQAVQRESNKKFNNYEKTRSTL